MLENFIKRIFTSIILLTILLICIFLNKYSWLILLIIASILSFFEFNGLLNKIWKNKKYYKFFFQIFCFSYLLLFIISGNILYQQGLNLTLFILFVCIFSDIGGYIIGKIIGGKKLTKISPNKTVSGSIGSLFFSTIPVFFYNIYDSHAFPITINIIILSLIISLTCQIGDLLISYFKRKAKVKDTGFLLPGHGGILDRMDGILFALPLGLLLLLLR
tara:strand:- start:823 stop:1473 length:651 start_codon:yes stop_codon:yes gene_type:complete